ncbi:PREDICTED: nematode resistance protein-like HSPRO2 [Ipomoea nil]|uniref:nematode resistance protein-like HSPRO2 n=1 Tax=Ipomoea nil TaxID=35883 RepID=UPI000900D222|nr:PREDICTED: nematode resistance protein-like HSPRO2 [Ipomoea nil]
MTAFDRKVKAELPSKSPRPSNKLHVSVPVASGRVAEAAEVAEAACLAYEHYVRLPELKELWGCKEFSGWKQEPLLKPALQGLEITFRFISGALSDPRPYANRREWKRRLESLARSQVEIIAMLCEDEEAEDGETRGAAPIVDLTSSDGTLARRNSSAEVWKLSDEVTVVSRTSEASLLPRLVTWRKSEDIAENILGFIESEMRKCPYTLGLGEANLNGKPSLDYDAIVKPSELHSLKKSPAESMNLQNFENQTLYTTHQILETWICASKSILNRIAERIESKSFGNAVSDCWILEKTWNLLTEIENLHLLMDPDDFLRLKHQLSIKVTAESQPFCFRSRGLVEITKLSKDLRQKVPGILDVEVDPNGGPRVQEAAMKLYAEKDGFERIHLVQGLQAIEMGVKRFYYSYKQLLTVVMGSLEAGDSDDSLAQVFLEPTYFPSLDAAKTFLAVHRSHEHGRRFSP